MMGYSYYSDTAPAMCFNGHKNYVLGWYADKQVSINPTANGPWSGKLVGFVDYTKASTSRNEYVLLALGPDLYIQYNLAEGFNSGTQEYGNKVTIVRAASSSSSSSLLVALTANQTGAIDSFSIDVCALVAATATTPKYMLLSVRLTTQGSVCAGVPTTAPVVTTAPTASAPLTSTPTTAAPVTLSPTDQIVSSPIAPIAPTAPITPGPVIPDPITIAPIIPAPITTAPITPAPTTSTPTLRPTNTPTLRPTNSPTLKPTNTPSKKPTNIPTRKPTISPTTQRTPTRRPTRLPTKKPT